MKPTAASTASSLLRFALFAYLLSMIVLSTLLPFRFQWPMQVRILAQANLFDVVTNLSLFLPLGFCYRLVRPEQRDRWGVRTLGVGMMLSVGIEMAQLFLRGRYSSVVDVALYGEVIYRLQLTTVQRLLTLHTSLSPDKHLGNSTGF